MIVVGDHSALHEPPLPSFKVPGCKWLFYGRALVFGHTASGKTLPVKLSVEQVSEWIEFL
jgi:hypothetical protein